MARNTKKTAYRLVTPPHMDVILNHFKSQDEAVTEAKKRGARNHTMLLVRNLEGEWNLIYDSRDDKDVEMKRLANMEYLQDSVDPATYNDLRIIMGRNPIEYYKRRVDGGMRLVSVFITENEDPLPFIRSIIMSDDFVCWPLPQYTESEAIKNFKPFGNDASCLFKEEPRQMEIKFAY